MGICALLRDRIIQGYNFYSGKGYCPIYAIENLTELYDQYKKLGGNGTISKLIDYIKALPTKEMD
jgi:hypothetical protein